MDMLRHEPNDTEPAKTYGDFIKQKREANGLSVRGLAAQLGITPAYVSDLEKGNRAAPRRNSPKNLLERICELLITSDDDRHRYYDLAAESRDGQYDELNYYLQQHANARLALRVARDGGVTEDDWSMIAEQIKKYSSIQ